LTGYDRDAGASDSVYSRWVERAVLTVGPTVLFLYHVQVAVVQSKAPELRVGSLTKTVKIELSPGHPAYNLGPGSGCGRRQVAGLVI